MSFKFGLHANIETPAKTDVKTLKIACQPQMSFFLNMHIDPAAHPPLVHL